MTVKIEIKGRIPDDPRARVSAIEAVTKAICLEARQDPAEGVMMLLTAAAHLTAIHSGKPPGEQLDTLARILGHASAAAEEFFPPHPTPANGGKHGRAH